MKNIFFIVFLFTLSCSPSSTKKVKVEHQGVLREIMHQGKYEGRVLLDSMNSKDLFAVGALDSLRGEVFINGGDVIVSRIVNDEVEISSGDNMLATLLVYSKVSEWDELKLSASSLDSLLKELSNDRKLEGAFPFQIKGTFPELEYHVINFDSKTGDLSKHKEGSWVGNLKGQPVTILGFYSTDHEGVFTHMASSLHMHVINEKNSLMGHIDKIDTGNKAFTLLLPSL